MCIRETRSAKGELTALQQHLCIQHQAYTQQCYTLFCYKTCSIEYTPHPPTVHMHFQSVSTYGCTDELPHVFLSLQLIRHESSARLFHRLAHALNTWQQVDHFRPTRQHAPVKKTSTQILLRKIPINFWHWNSRISSTVIFRISAGSWYARTCTCTVWGSIWTWCFAATAHVHVGQATATAVAFYLLEEHVDVIGELFTHSRNM